MQAPIIGYHHDDAILDEYATDDARNAAFEHLADRSLLAPAPVDADDAREHAIAVQHLAHLGGREIQILALVRCAIVGTQETEAFGVGNDGAGNQIEFFRYTVTT